MASFDETLSREEQVFNKVREYLDSQKLRYYLSEDGAYIDYMLNLNSKLSSCRMVILPGEKDIRALGIAPIKACEDAYSDVVEFITRANYNMRLGKFEFDYSDGEIRFQTCLPCRDGLPNMKDIEITVDLPMIMLQRYGDGLVKNMLGYGDPEADIREIEGGD